MGLSLNSGNRKQSYKTPEPKNVLKDIRDQKWQKTHHVTQSFLQVEGHGYRKPRRVLLPKFGERGRDVPFFLFVYLRQEGIEMSTVGGGLTWATRCSCPRH